MSTEDRHKRSPDADGTEDRLAPTAKKREITVEEAKASTRKATNRYKRALQELARR